MSSDKYGKDNLDLPFDPVWQEHNEQLAKKQKFEELVNRSEVMKAAYRKHLASKMTTGHLEFCISMAKSVRHLHKGDDLIKHDKEISEIEDVLKERTNGKSTEE